MATTINGATIGSGVNLQPSYYNGGQVNSGWNLMQQYPNIKTVRIEIEPDKATQAVQWISQARAHGYQVIATYHKSVALGTNNAGELTAAANWWRSNLHTFGAGVIPNLYNEWGDHHVTAATFASAYNNAIAAMRHFYNGPIIIDVPGWGQDVDTARNAQINDHNIIYSVHIYQQSWNSGTGQFLTTNDLDRLHHTGRPCIVGEFGTGNAGQCNWSACVNHARQLGWSVVGWCWNGDGGNMNMADPSLNIDPTAQDFTPSAYFHTIYDKLPAAPAA